MPYNSCKAKGWCNTLNLIYLVCNELPQTASIDQFPTGYNVHQLSLYFAVVICVYIILLYRFYIKWLFTKLFSFHFQRIAIYTCIGTLMVTKLMMTETSKTINFWARFFYKMLLLQLAMLFIGVIFSIGKFVSGRW